jgi:hypothetical protein
MTYRKAIRAISGIHIAIDLCQHRQNRVVFACLLPFGKTFNTLRVALAVDMRPRRREKKEKRSSVRLCISLKMTLNVSKENSSPPCPLLSSFSLSTVFFVGLYRTLLFVLSTTKNKHSCVSLTQRRHSLRILSPTIIHMEKDRTYTSRIYVR